MPLSPVQLRKRDKRKTRKKHVESMFLVNRLKAYPYYFKDRKLFGRIASDLRKTMPLRKRFSIKILDSGYITIAPLKAIMRLYKWYVKAQGIEEKVALKLNVFPDFVLTSKPKEMRMGKGKGAPDSKVAPIKAGSILLSIVDKGAGPYLIKKLVGKLAWKIPFRHQVVYNNW